MSGLLLDTNVVSELTRPDPNPNVSVFVSRRDDLWLAAMVVYEIEVGVNLLPQGRRRDRLALANKLILSAFRRRILPLERVGAEWAAKLRADARRRGQPLSLSDALIAGTAMASDLTLVTRNVKDFDGLGLDLVNPWEEVLP